MGYLSVHHVRAIFMQGIMKCGINIKAPLYIVLIVVK